MKLYDIPINTLVELQFIYMNEKHMISAALLYKYKETIYVTAVKSAGTTIPARKFRNFSLVYKNDAGVYSFLGLSPRTVSYCGQNLYAIPGNIDAQVINHRNAYRLFVGTPIAVKISLNGVTKHQDCILKDISMTGMCILSTSRIEDFSKLEVSFRVNENTVEKLMASIVHYREFRSGSGYMYGCEFDAPNETIGKYIQRKLAAKDADAASS